MPRRAKSSIPATSPGQPYGVAGEQKAAMASVPIADRTAQSPVAGSAPNTADPTVAAAIAGGGAGPAAVGGGDPTEALALMMAPTAPQDLIDAPTSRPDEPVTAGLPIGPGPMSTSLDFAPGGGGTSQVIRAMLQSYDSPTLRALLDDAMRRGQ